MPSSAQMRAIRAFNPTTSASSRATFALRAASSPDERSPPDPQVAALQAADARLDFGLRRLHDRQPAGLLIAAGDQGVESQGVGVGHGVLLFDQGAKDARFQERESGKRICHSYSLASC